MLTGSLGVLADSDRRDRPDFIVLDVLMPGLNRVETLRGLMQADGSLKVVMLVVFERSGSRFWLDCVLR